MPVYGPEDNMDRAVSSPPWLMFLSWVPGDQPHGLGRLWPACRKCSHREEPTSRKVDTEVCIHRHLQILPYRNLKKMFSSVHEKQQSRQNIAVCQAMIRIVYIGACLLACCILTLRCPKEGSGYLFICSSWCFVVITLFCLWVFAFGRKKKERVAFVKFLRCFSSSWPRCELHPNSALSFSLKILLIYAFTILDQGRGDLNIPCRTMWPIYLGAGFLQGGHILSSTCASGFHVPVGQWCPSLIPEPSGMFWTHSISLFHEDLGSFPHSMLQEI